MKTEKLAAQILYREGLNKWEVVSLFIQDYYAGVDVKNTTSVWDYFNEVVLLNKSQKPVYARSIERVLRDFFSKTCKDLIIKKEAIYSYMDGVRETEGLWDADYMGDFLEFVMLHTQEFEESEFDFNWLVDDVCLSDDIEDIDEIVTHLFNRMNENLPS